MNKKHNQTSSIPIYRACYYLDYETSIAYINCELLNIPTL